MRQALPVRTADRTLDRRSVLHVGAAVAAVEDRSDSLFGGLGGGEEGEVGFQRDSLVGGEPQLVVSRSTLTRPLSLTNHKALRGADFSGLPDPYPPLETAC